MNFKSVTPSNSVFNFWIYSEIYKWIYYLQVINTVYSEIFYNINNVIYALVQTFRKAKNSVSDQKIEEHLNKYFLICHLSEEYETIHYRNIDTKCIILNFRFVIYCNEHN